jgi:hypothetical protein
VANSYSMLSVKTEWQHVVLFTRCTGSTSHPAGMHPVQGVDHAAVCALQRALIMASKRQAAFPGLNAPLPDGADVAAWSASEHEAKAGQVAACSVGHGRACCYAAAFNLIRLVSTTT